MSIRGWRPYTRPALVEECICLDISELNRDGFLVDKTVGNFLRSWKWPNGDVTNAKLEVNMGDSKYGPHIMLRLDGKQEQLIFLEATQPNFGGKRWWFICLTGKRCRKLYLPHGAADFLCREELQLTYESQHVEKVWRLQNRVRQLRAKLDVGNRSPALPGKPKGMWNRTYNGLVNRIADAQSDAIREMLHWTRRCYGYNPFAGALD